MGVGQAERAATASEVRVHAEAVRDVLADAGLREPRMADDGSVVVHSDAPSLLVLGRVTTQLHAIVGYHVRLFFDSTPAAARWATSPL
ncbi:hypothetical protein [Euzebya sp.]|uniref:hypothetical protein n=1 Tax=Euzebya sp. TaxID=1971409 RepID=UPI003511E17A